MGRSKEKFAQLLTEGVHRIRIYESKAIRIVHDELGYVLGREGGSVIEFWRKGHIPPKMFEIEKLGREIVKRGRLKQTWLEQFLDSADYPNGARLIDELFPPALPEEQLESQVSERSPLPLPPPIPPRGPEFAAGEELVPFIVGPPITAPSHFFGRAYELKRIFDLWKRFPLQNVAVIGQKRSGKTSLLHYIKNITIADPAQLRPGQKTNWLPRPEPYRWVFVDFQDTRMCSRERLLSYLLTCLEMPVPQPCDLYAFMDVVSEQLRTPAVILMDEISAALASPELDQQFWGSLRSLGSNLTGGNLAFLLTSHESPDQLAREQGKPSPFFNIFGHTFTLKPLREREARELIASSPRPFDPADVEWILEQSKGWPLLLQILCHSRLTALEHEETGEAWKQRGLRQMGAHRHLMENL